VKRRIVAVTTLAAAVAVIASACSSSSPSGTQPSTSKAAAGLLSTSGAGKTISVWLQSDAQKGWPDVVNQANQRFEQATGAKVNVQWQQW
jgi:N,N'-diacetylchitobiose transport system substrate-binding protein